MNCATARSLIALHRSGERTEQETRALEEHCAGCPSCADELRAEIESFAALQRVAGRNPILADPDRFTDDVISSLPARHRKPARGIVDVLFHPVERPVVRVALMTLVVCFIGSFGIEMSELVAGISHMERQYARTGEEKAGMQIAYRIDIGSLPVTRAQRREIQSAGLIPLENGHLLVTLPMLRICRSFLARPEFLHDTRITGFNTLTRGTVLQSIQSAPYPRMHLIGNVP